MRDPPRWVNNALGGVFYVPFGCLLVSWFLPRVRPGRIAWTVLAVTCLLEFLPRWRPPWLECLWHFWSDQLLLGTTFTGLGPVLARRPAGGDPRLDRLPNVPRPVCDSVPTIRHGLQALERIRSQQAADSTPITRRVMSSLTGAVEL